MCDFLLFFSYKILKLGKLQVPHKTWFCLCWLEMRHRTGQKLEQHSSKDSPGSTCLRIIWKLVKRQTPTAVHLKRRLRLGMCMLSSSQVILPWKLKVSNFWFGLLAEEAMVFITCLWAPSSLSMISHPSKIKSQEELVLEISHPEGAGGFNLNYFCSWRVTKYILKLLR